MSLFRRAPIEPPPQGRTAVVVLSVGEPEIFTPDIGCRIEAISTQAGDMLLQMAWTDPTGLSRPSRGLVLYAAGVWRKVKWQDAQPTLRGEVTNMEEALRTGGPFKIE